MATKFRPTHGEPCELELVGDVVVRCPFTRRRHESGDVVEWSTYYARRLNDGAIIPRAIRSAKTAKAAPSPSAEGGKK